LDGWTLNGEIGGISENSTFWEEKFPKINQEQYFSGDGKEAGKGTLTSSWFKVGGVKKITFMLGAAGNKDCYITLENTDGTVLAIWRNAKFEDVAGKWDYNEIGETQFACNLVTYVADLGAYAGETLRIVLHDNAESGFGFFNFDELVTYYAAEADVPVKATVAVNELADKAELKTLVDGALSARGDYTDESYNAYAEKVAAAQKVLDKISATQTEADAAKAAIETAYKALQLRTPAEKADADKSFSLLFNGSKELTVSDYIDDNSLSSLTYEVTSADAKVTVSAVADGKFTVTAGNEEVDGAQIVIAVKYKGEEKLRVTITVKVTSETAPVLKKTAVETDIDLYSAENKTDITLDFASNVDNVGGLTLDYAATLDGSPLTLDGASYTFAYGSYTETATEVVFTVTVSFSQNGENKELSYTYTLNIKDTRAYRIANGGFDNGLDGWTLSNSDLGGVNADTRYWDGIPFNNDGNFFNAYYFNGEAKEDATGTLKSAPFTVGGSGWITYKLGGAKNIETVTFEIVSAADETKRAVLPNFDWSDVAGNTQVRGCTLVAYKANLLDYGFDKGESVYILATDNAVSDYGLFFLDSVVTYYPQAPEGNFNLVAPTRLFNGGFESGLSGWEVKTTEDGGGEFGFLSTNAGATWGDENNPKSYNNDGNFFQNGCEQSKGYLLSSVFEVSQSGWITFKLAGNKALNYVAVVDAETGDVLAKFVNENYVGAWPNNGWEMYAYKANLVESGIEAGRKVRIKVVDDAIGDYGVVVVDSFVTHYVAEPDGEFTKANNTL
ncbi:MAG: FIVAR domain-containing protein, partial [Clostridia bacterium]|nr:FIVAR domain-containing protein [Clostridia bacterium]